MAELIEEKKFLSQRELAERWRRTESSIKNFRDRGHLPYFRLPGSARVLYPVEAVKELERQHTKSAREVVPKRIKASEMQRVKPVVSSNQDEDWRI